MHCLQEYKASISLLWQNLENLLLFLANTLTDLFLQHCCYFVLLYIIHHQNVHLTTFAPSPLLKGEEH